MIKAGVFSVIRVRLRMIFTLSCNVLFLPSNAVIFILLSKVLSARQDRFLLDEFRHAAPETALKHIAGCRRYLPPRPGLDADELRSHLDQSAKALWLFDKVSKNFLVACWRARAATLGSVNLVDGQLVHKAATTAFPVFKPCIVPVGLDPFAIADRPWKAWGPAVQAGTKWCSTKMNNFFVVWQGRHTGVFYRWRDVCAVTSGWAGAKFKGFDSLAAAEEAFTIIKPP